MHFYPFHPYFRNMHSAKTDQVEITVKTQYEGERNRILNGPYVFSYVISITNHAAEAVQLLRRHWFIIDGDGQKREVEGLGVIGQQPIILPGETYTYNSFCPLSQEVGKMCGFYTMIRPIDEHLFVVDIPEFSLTVPYRAN